MTFNMEFVYARFNEFEQFKIENNKASEGQVSNCGKSGFPLKGGSSINVFCDKHYRHTFPITSSYKTLIAIQQCMCNFMHG